LTHRSVQTEPLSKKCQMDRVAQQPVKDLPNLFRTGSFSLDRLLSHIDPGPAEEPEAFVRLIYEQRHLALR
jgi:hypothetical protein